MRAPITKNCRRIREIAAFRLSAGMAARTTTIGAGLASGRHGHVEDVLLQGAAVPQGASKTVGQGGGDFRTAGVVVHVPGVFAAVPDNGPGSPDDGEACLRQPFRLFAELVNAGLVRRAQDGHDLEPEQPGTVGQLGGRLPQEKVLDGIKGIPARGKKGAQRDQQVGAEKPPEQFFARLHAAIVP